jgi:hypothetical protein
VCVRQRVDESAWGAVPDPGRDQLGADSARNTRPAAWQPARSSRCGACGRATGRPPLARWPPQRAGRAAARPAGTGHPRRRPDQRPRRAGPRWASARSPAWGTGSGSTGYGSSAAAVSPSYWPGTLPRSALSPAAAGPWPPGRTRPSAAHAQRRAQVAHELAAGLDEWRRELGERLAVKPEPWLTRYLGVLSPDASPALREEYVQRAGTAASYREARGITDPQQAVSFGPHPEPELAAMQRDTFQALEIADEHAEIRAMSRGELEARVLQGERAQATAPPDVSGRLRLTAHRRRPAVATSPPPGGATGSRALTPTREFRARTAGDCRARG